MSKQKLQEAANRLFAIHKLEEIHMTADGQGFSEHHRAQSHALTLKDENVYTFEPFEEKTTKNDVDKDRDALVVKYEEVFGSAPGHNWKSATIQSKIDAKLKETTAPETSGVPEVPETPSAVELPEASQTPVVPGTHEDNKE